MEPIELYKVEQQVATTDDYDFARGKPGRKLAVGELLQPLGEPRVNEAGTITRLQIKALKDNREGWVTLQGSKGGTFVVPSKSHYKVLAACALEQQLATGSTQVRALA